MASSLKLINSDSGDIWDSGIISFFFLKKEKVFIDNNHVHSNESSRVVYVNGVLDPSSSTSFHKAYFSSAEVVTHSVSLLLIYSSVRI